MDGGQQLAGVLPVGPGGALAPPVVDVAELVDAAVPLPCVGDHGRARLHVVGDEGVQRLRGRAGTGAGIRHRPSPFGSPVSTAMQVKTFLPGARPPRSPAPHRR